MSGAGAWIGAVLIGYCMGCLLMAWFIGFLKNRNVLENGNGNPGASNATMVYGIKYGAVTAAWDILKPMIAFVLSSWVLKAPPQACLLSAYMAVVGHVFPFWNRFKGGKGFAPYLGSMFCIQPIAILFTAAIAAFAAFFTDYITGATFFVIAACPLWAWLAGWHYGVPVTLLSLLLLWRHRENIANIKNGTEPRITEVLGRHREKIDRIAGAIKGTDDSDD